jgi:Transcriptional regulators
MMAQKPASQPLYRRIYEELKEELKSSGLRPGERLPSEHELSRRFGVSRITSKRVLEMLKEEGLVERVPGKGTYLKERGRAARKDGGTRPSGSRLIGLVMSQFGDEFGATLVRSIEAACRGLGYHVVLNLTYEDQRLEEESIARLLDLGVDGFILQPCHGEFYNSSILKLVLAGFPLVFVDRRLRGLSASTVSSDNEAAAKAATDYLLDRRHRSILFVSRRIENSSSLEDRLEGFMRSQVERGAGFDKERQVLELPPALPTGVEGPSRDGLDAELAKIRRRLEGKPRITAALAAEYSLAVLVRKAAEGLGRPVEVVCFDAPGQSLALLRGGEGHYVLQPEASMGSEAVRIAHELIEGTRSEVEDLRLPVRFT